jgi:chaperonin GroEL (HSP60 family)
MLKMLMDPMGGIVMTNDGNAILREITVQHPAAKTMIEIARTQVTFDNMVLPILSRYFDVFIF